MASRVGEIRVDRSWIGPPAGGQVNPTVWLFIVTLVLFATGSGGYLLGLFPGAAAVLVNTVAIYLGFTVLHEGMHGVAHRNRLVNVAMARITGALLTIPFPLFRGVHYEHHSHTNDPERDPDLIVARRPRWLLPVWCLGVAIEYRTKFYGHRLWRDQRELAEAIVMDLALPAIVVTAAVGGWFVPLFVIWLAPAAAAVLYLAFVFDFLPHYPYDTDARYFDTRIYPGEVLFALLLGQNYHLIHHLWTTIPWFRYRRVFDQIHGELEERGCRIGWSVEPLPDGVPLLERRSA